MREISKTYSLIFLFSLIATMTTGQESAMPHNVSPDRDILSKYSYLSAKQLLDTANHQRLQNRYDEALIYYNLLIAGMGGSKTDSEHLPILLEACGRAAGIHVYLNNYRAAYELLIKSLQLIENHGDTLDKTPFILNMGYIYFEIGRYDLAKQFFREALNFWQDTTVYLIALNNLGYLEAKKGNVDSAFHFLNLSRQIAESRDAYELCAVMNTTAVFYARKRNYDSTFYYYHLSLYYADLHGNHYQKARTLADMGQLFFELNQLDSAEFYVELADIIAKKHHFPRFLMENRLILSKIAKAKGNKAAALEYLEQHLKLRTSILDLGIIIEINQLQHSYERSKTDQQIEYLTTTQAVKDKIIHHQKISNTTMLIVLILIGSLLAFMFVQHKKLNTAYKKLFEKGIKIIEIQGDFPEGHLKKQKKHLPDEMQNELLNRIYSVMEDTTTICNTEFSLEELASLVQSNRVYVSQIINDVLKKNFRTFINEYRIREAQRLFSSSDASKYTIESIALQTGFKSRSTFNIAFKEVTGVSPGFYLKSMLEL